MNTRRLNIDQFEIASPAKVNLFLELPLLPKKRDDGFNEIETVMSTVSIFDRLTFAPREDSRISLSLHPVFEKQFESVEIPTDSRNLIIKSFELIRSIAKSEAGSDCSTGVDITLQKHIPSAAGLGGGSSNAAAAILAANRIWNLKWSQSKLEKIAAQIGSDVPFFLTGGTAVCRGRGEIIHAIPAPAGQALVVVKPKPSLSTAKVFSSVSASGSPESSNQLIESVQSGNVRKIGAGMFNRLQEFAEPLTDQISRLRHSFLQIGSCLGHQMSGSGSSYFGLFANRRSARRAAQRLSARHPEARIFYCHTLSPLMN